MILKNAIITPDGTELVSEHTHDFKMYKDTVTGKEYGVDGGREYQRLIGDMDDCEVIYITLEECSHVQAREYFTWGTCGKDGYSPLVWKKLKDLDTDHIEAIIKTQKQISSRTLLLFETELEFRKL